MSTQVKNTEFKDLAKSLNVKFTKGQTMAQKVAAVRVEFAKLAEDKQHDLLKPMFAAGTYDDSNAPLDIFDSLVVEEETTTVHGKGSANEVTYTYQNRERTVKVATTANPALRSTIKVAFTGCDVTAQKSGEDWDTTKGEDVLKGAENKTIMIHGVTSDGRSISMSTNLRAMYGIKNTRIFGAPNEKGNGIHLPSKLFTEAGELKPVKNLYFTINGLAIDPEVGHTYVNTTPACVSAAKKLIDDNKLPKAVIVPTRGANNTDVEGVLCFYDREKDFRFDSFGSLVSSDIEISIFDSELKRAQEVQNKMEFGVLLDAKNELARAAHLENNEEVLKAATKREAALKASNNIEQIKAYQSAGFSFEQALLMAKN